MELRCKQRHIGDSSKKVTRKNVLWQKYCHFIDFVYFYTLNSVQKHTFIQLNQNFCCKFPFSGIINCNTFSVAPSITNEKVKNVLFQCFDCFYLSAILKNIFLLIKTKVYLKIDFIDNINCDTFSVAPSIIINNLLQRTTMSIKRSALKG